jgi:hypothetical protein
MYQKVQAKVRGISVLQLNQHTYRIEVMNETSSSSIPEVRNIDLLILLIFQVYFKFFLEVSPSFIIL